MERSTVGSLLRTSQAFCSQLCEKHTLDFGIAYFQPRFADLAELNQFREVVVEDDRRLPSAFEEAERWFANQNLFCYRWAPAGGNPGPGMIAFLKVRGFRLRSHAAMLLNHWETLGPYPEVRILPARAVRTAFHETFVAAGGSATSASVQAIAQAGAERLDDPQFDMFVAMVGGTPAGRCALYQVGDIARVIDLTVVPGFQSTPAADALVAHALAMAKRLQMRNVVIQIDDGDAAGISWWERLGFARDGTIIEFERERPPPPT